VITPFVDVLGVVTLKLVSPCGLVVRANATLVPVSCVLRLLYWSYIPTSTSVMSTPATVSEVFVIYARWSAAAAMISYASDSALVSPVDVAVTL